LPHDLARGSELIEESRRVAGEPGREDLSLQSGSRQRDALEALDHGEQRVQVRLARPRSADAVPREREARQRVRGRGLDLFPVRGQGSSPEASQHLDVDPFGSHGPGSELAFYHSALDLEPFEGAGDHGPARSESRGHVVGDEWSVGPRVTRHQVTHGIRYGLEERARHANRQCSPESVPEPSRVLDRHEAVLSGDADHQSPAVVAQRLRPLGTVVRHRARPHLFGGHVPEGAENVVQLVGRADLPLVDQTLKLEFQLVERLGIQQLAELLATHDLGQERTI
jgi:hypothetical protein